MRWAGVAVVVGVGLVGCGAVAPGRAVRAAVPGRPVLAPGPVPLVRTVDVTVTRTSPSDAAQSIRVHPDGVWQFTPAQGSALAMVVNGGRLDPATHARLAVLLAAPALRAEAALPDEPCPAGYRYSVVAGPTTAAWTQCGASQRPTLSAVLALVEAAEPKF